MRTLMPQGQGLQVACAIQSPAYLVKEFVSYFKNYLFKNYLVKNSTNHTQQGILELLKSCQNL